MILGHGEKGKRKACQNGAGPLGLGGEGTIRTPGQFGAKKAGA